MHDFLPGQRVMVSAGRFARTVGIVQQPPGKAWPDANGYVGLLLQNVKPKESGVKLFPPSQLTLI
jgi:hypothetical protein